MPIKVDGMIKDFQTHQWMPKLVGEGEIRSRIPSLKEIFYKMLNNHIGGNNNFIVKKIGRHHFNLVIKLTSPIMGHVDMMH